MSALALSLALQANAAYYTTDQAAQDNRDNGSADLHVDIKKDTSTSQEFIPGNVGTPSDQRILNEINDLLRRYYSGYNINIHINNGVVTVKGVVRSSNDILDIQNSLLRIDGVKSVDNQLNATGK